MTKEAKPLPVDSMSFEDAMRALEAIVDELEKGETGLEASIALYERGAALRRHCEAKLRDAEMRVEKIVQGEGGTAAGLEPFATE